MLETKRSYRIGPLQWCRESDVGAIEDDGLTIRIINSLARWLLKVGRRGLFALRIAVTHTRLCNLLDDGTGLSV